MKQGCLLHAWQQYFSLVKKLLFNSSLMKGILQAVSFSNANLFIIENKRAENQALKTQNEKKRILH